MRSTCNCCQDFSDKHIQSVTKTHLTTVHGVGIIATQTLHVRLSILVIYFIHLLTVFNMLQNTISNIRAPLAFPAGLSPRTQTVSVWYSLKISLDNISPGAQKGTDFCVCPPPWKAGGFRRGQNTTARPSLCLQGSLKAAGGYLPPKPKLRALGGAKSLRKRPV